MVALRMSRRDHAIDQSVSGRLLHAPARALRHEEDHRDNHDPQDQGSNRPAEVEAAMIKRLVKEVSHRSAKGPGQDEGAPKQQDAICLSQGVQQRQHQDARAEERRTAGGGWLFAALSWAKIRSPAERRSRDAALAARLVGWLIQT